jgi:hypothetical protein
VSRIARRKLRKKMLPFVRQLPASDADPSYRAYGPNLDAIKSVTSRRGLRVYSTQIGGDGMAWRSVGLEPVELRMMAIAFRFSP